MVGGGVLMETWPVSCVMWGGGRAVVVIGKKGRSKRKRGCMGCARWCSEDGVHCW